MAEKKYLDLNGLQTFWNKILDILDGKLDSNGDANDVTFTRISTARDFANIPENTPTTLQALITILGRWYEEITSKYTKPSTGIPASDLAEGVVPPVFVCDSGDDFDTLDAAFRSGKVLVHADYGVMYDGEVGTFYQFRSNSGWGYYLHTCTKNASPEWSTEAHDCDTAPTQGSSAPVTSSGLYTALSGKLGTTGNAYRAASIPFGVVDSTSTATAFTATVDGITELRDGVCAYIRNGTKTSAAGCTLNVNNLGAKPIYSTVAATTAVTTTFNVNYTMLFIYNSTRVSGGCWDMYYGYDANTTYTPVKLGFGYTTCSTAEATTAKTASLSSYTLVAGGIVAVKFTNAVPAGATLNVNSKGAKAIYYRGAAITDGVIKAGDTVTFIYSTYYHVLSIDRAADAYIKPSGGIPASDLASGVIPEKLVVTYTLSGLVSGATVTCDKTYDEILTALQAGYAIDAYAVYYNTVVGRFTSMTFDGSVIGFMLAYASGSNGLPNNVFSWSIWHATSGVGPLKVSGISAGVDIVPEMDGIASSGSNITYYALADHVHPTDTTRSAKWKYTTLTLATSDWSASGNSYVCTKVVMGMTSMAIGIIEYSDYSYGIIDAQGTNTLYFTASALPSAAVTVYVAFVEGEAV